MVLDVLQDPIAEQLGERGLDGGPCIPALAGEGPLARLLAGC